MRNTLQEEFAEAFAASGLTHREFKATYKVDPAYLSSSPRATVDALTRGLGLLGRTVQFRVFDPEEGPDRGPWLTDESTWEL